MSLASNSYQVEAASSPRRPAAGPQCGSTLLQGGLALVQDRVLKNKTPHHLGHTQESNQESGILTCAILSWLQTSQVPPPHRQGTELHIA